MRSRARCATAAQTVAPVQGWVALVVSVRQGSAAAGRQRLHRPTQRVDSCPRLTRMIRANVQMLGGVSMGCGASLPCWVTGAGGRLTGSKQRHERGVGGKYAAAQCTLIQHASS